MRDASACFTASSRPRVLTRGSSATALNVAEANEWFSVPVGAIEEATQLIEAESIENYEWDPDSRSLRLRA